MTTVEDSNGLRQFKDKVLEYNISGCILSRRNIPLKWGMPLFIKKYQMYDTIFGKEAYSIFEKMDDASKQKMVEWFENDYGREANDMFGGTAWEDDDKLFTFDLKLLKKNNSSIFENVVTKITRTLFQQCNTETQDKIIKGFIVEPHYLEDLLKS